MGNREMTAGDAARLPGFSAETQRIWRHRRVIEGIDAEGAGGRWYSSLLDVAALWATGRQAADGRNLRLAAQLGRMASRAIVALLREEPGPVRFVVSTSHSLDGEVTPADDLAALGPFERAIIIIHLQERVRSAPSGLRLAAQGASRH
jgi:hypothetical protein